MKPSSMGLHRAFVAVLLVGVCNLCHAAPPYLSGNSLLASLAPQKNAVESTFATAYIVGIVDSMNGIKLASISTCFSIPDDVSFGQLNDVVRLYLERNPGGRHFSAPWLVSAALQEAFPCSSK